MEVISENTQQYLTKTKNVSLSSVLRNANKTPKTKKKKPPNQTSPLSTLSTTLKSYWGVGN